MRSRISSDFEVIYRFLKTVKENPGLSITNIFFRCNSSYYVISDWKNILVVSGFCKINGANRTTSNIEITHDGEMLLGYIERIIENNK